MASRTFLKKSDAEKWTRETEALIERGEYQDKTQTKEKGRTLGQLVERYRASITVKKKGVTQETYILNAFLRHNLAKKKVEQVTVTDFVKHRDECLKHVKPIIIKIQLAILHYTENPCFNIIQK